MSLDSFLLIMKYGCNFEATSKVPAGQWAGMLAWYHARKKLGEDFIF